MGVKVAYLESISAEEIAALEGAGVHSTDDLLGRLADSDTRAGFGARTGLASETVHRLAGMADLMRITGIGEPHTQLLDALDVGSTAALAQQDATALIKAMRRKNVEILVVRGMPPESTVARWINDAKVLVAA
jgi:hypothetical protein